MPLLVVLAAAAVVSSVPLLLFSLSAGRSTSGQVGRNLAAGMDAPTNLREIVLTRPVRQRAIGPLVLGLARRSRRLTPVGVVDALDHRLVLAGLPWRVEVILVAKFALAFGGLAVSLVFLVVERSAITAFLPPLVWLVGWLLPDVLVTRRADGRQRRIRDDLPDVLDQLTICVEAGLAFDAALLRVARTGSGPLGHEIRRVLQDIQLGMTRADALESLLSRTNVRELRQFIHAINQADNFGVPVASVLRAQADEHREARYGRAEIRAQELPVKIVFPLVLCILPSLFVVILGPAFLQIRTAFGG